MASDRINVSLGWYRTTVFRAVLLASFLILGGYLGGLLSIKQALQSLAGMAYDEDLDRALADYMNSLKELDASKRQTFLLEIKSLIDEDPVREMDERRLRQLLHQADFENLAPLDRIQIRVDKERLRKNTIEWISRTELAIGKFVVDMPLSEVRIRFESVQQIKQKYQLMEATWDKEIAPSLLLTNTLILIATFSSVGFVLVLLVRRYIRHVNVVLKGFRRWSEVDASYRINTDLSGEMSVIAQQFNDMADEVELNRKKTLYLEKMSSWQTMARKLAHEIKNPLTPIQMMVSQLQRKYKGEDESFGHLLQEATTIIHEEVNALRRMVDHFSQFARLPDPTWEKADLLYLCQKILELEKAAFPEHQLNLLTKLEQAPLMMDSQLIRQVLINLIKNAAEASHDRQATIELRLGEDQKDYLLSVVDDGPGIKAEDLPRIFEAYYTTKHTGPNPGMGLGLAICKKIVMDHQGELTASSQSGQTEFLIRIPKQGMRVSDKA